jgi:hypothetical protein
MAAAIMCEGLHAYFDVVLSYYEMTTDNYKRLDDASWADMLAATPPPDEVPWTADFTSTP